MGIAVGPADGSTLGNTDGNSDVNTDGIPDGITEYSLLGTVDGLAVGSTKGANPEGAMVGLTDGV